MVVEEGLHLGRHDAAVPVVGESFGEDLGRTFAEVKRRPVYIVASTTDELDPPRGVLITWSAPSTALGTVERQFERIEAVALREARNEDPVLSR